MEKGKQTILQGALILTASTMVVKVIGALFKIPLANILGGVGMSYFVSAYDVLIPIYSMTVTGLGVAVSRMVSEYGGRGEEAGNILKTARLMFLGIGTLAAVLLFIGAGPLTKLIGNPAAALSVCCIAPSVLFSCLSSAYRGYFQGRQNMLPTARSQVVEAMVKLVAGILLAWFFYSRLNDAAMAGTLGWLGTMQEVQLRILQYSAAGAVLGVSLSTLCGLLFIRGQYRRNVPERGGRFSSTDAKKLWHVALPIALTSLCANLTTVIDLSSVMNCLKNAVEQGSEHILRMYTGCIPPEVTVEVLPEYLYGSYSGLAVSIFNLVPAVTAGIGMSAIPAIARYCAAKDLDEDEKKEYLEDLGVESSGLDKLVAASYSLLGLISFLTAGEDECRAWTIKKGTKAPQAAGKIHTDFERGFIKAEVVNYQDLLDNGSLAAAREKGIVGMEGKEYVVKDGDVILFRFNV